MFTYKNTGKVKIVFNAPNPVKLHVNKIYEVEPGKTVDLPVKITIENLELTDGEMTKKTKK